MPSQLLCTAHRETKMVEYAAESPGDGEFLVQCQFGAEKHGTMLSFWGGYGNQRGRWDDGKKLFLNDGIAWNYPIGLGNMQVGVVSALGKNVTRVKEGDRVLSYGGFRPSLLRHEDDLRPGGVGPGWRAAWKMPASVDWRSAVCLDPLVYALAPLRDGNARIGDAVAISGLGALGLLAVQAAKIAGLSPVIALDPLENRRDIALRTGADLALDPTAVDAGLALKEATGGRGPDVILEYSGKMKAVQAAIRGIAFGGTVVMAAFPGPMEAGLDLGAEAHMNRPDLIFSRSESEPWREHPRWDDARCHDAAWRLIEEGRIRGEEVVFPVIPFGPGLPEAYHQMAEHPETHVKLGVSY